MCKFSHKSITTSLISLLVQDMWSPTAQVLSVWKEANFTKQLTALQIWSRARRPPRDHVTPILGGGEQDGGGNLLPEPWKIKLPGHNKEGLST